MRFRFPDKPNEIISLDGINQNDYLVQVKIDGWRCITYFDDSRFDFYSRHKRRMEINPGIIESLMELNLPEGTVLDGELLGRRPGQSGSEEILFLFDVLYWQGIWMGGFSAEDRWNYLLELNFPDTNLIGLPAWGFGGAAKLFELSKKTSITEGIVLKHRGSRLVGHIRDCAKNRMWLKYKWRGGSDGQSLTGN